MYAWVMIRGHSVVSYIIIITPCNEANNDVVKSLPHVRSMPLQVCKTLPHAGSMLLQVCKTLPHVRSMLLQVCKTLPHVRKCFCNFAKPRRTSGSASASLQNLAARQEVLLQLCRTLPHVRSASTSLFALIMAV